MSGWAPSYLLPGCYVTLLVLALAAALRRWYDPLPRRVLGIFGAVLLLLFGKVLLGGSVLLPLDNLRHMVPFQGLPPAHPHGNYLQSDLIHQIAPTLAAVRRALAAGSWPLWDSSVGIGMPLLADPQAQVLQPLLLAALPLPLVDAAGVTAALRVLVALVFAFLLLRRQGLGEGASLVGSLAYGLGGFVQLWLGWPLANAAALLPLALYAAVRCDQPGRRRDALLLAAALFALLMAGQPEAATYALALTGLFALARLRRPAGPRLPLLLRYGGAALLAGALAAPVLLPTARYVPHTERSAALGALATPRSPEILWLQVATPEGRRQWRERAAARLLPVAAPNAFGNNRYGAYWGGTNINQDGGGFVGSAALLAALLAVASPAGARLRQERLVLAVLAASLLAIAQPPALTPFLVRLPAVGFTAVHAHHRLLLVIGFCVAYLAAATAERVARGEMRRRGAVVAALALAVLVAWTYLAHPHPDGPRVLGDRRMLWLAAQLLALGAAATALARGRRTLPWWLCLPVAAELLLFHGPANPPMPRRLALPVTAPLRFLQENLGDSRMVGIGPALPANLAGLYGLADVRLYNPMRPYAHQLLTAPLKTVETGLRFGKPGHPLYDLMGVRWILARSEIRLGPPHRLAFRHWRAAVWQRPGALPLLFLPNRAEVYRGGGHWSEWTRRNPSFFRRALVQPSPGHLESWRARAPRASRLADLRVAPARIRARAALASERLLASSVFQDGGWRLLVDGGRWPTVLVNGPLAGAWLPAGEHRLELLYRPPGWLAGCLLAALGVAAGLLWWIPPPVAATAPASSAGSTWASSRAKLDST